MPSLGFTNVDRQGPAGNHRGYNSVSTADKQGKLATLVQKHQKAAPRLPRTVPVGGTMWVSICGPCGPNERRSSRRHAVFGCVLGPIEIAVGFGWITGPISSQTVVTGQLRLERLE